MDILTHGSSVVKPEIPSDKPKQNILVATYRAGGTKHAMFLAALAIEQGRLPTSYHKPEIQRLTGVSERTADNIIQFFRAMKIDDDFVNAQISAHGWMPSTYSLKEKSSNTPNHAQSSSDQHIVTEALKRLKQLGWGRRADGYMCYTDSEIAEFIRENGVRNVLYAISASDEPNIRNRCALIRTNLRNGLTAPRDWTFLPPSCNTDQTDQTATQAEHEKPEHSQLPIPRRDEEQASYFFTILPSQSRLVLPPIPFLPRQPGYIQRRKDATISQKANGAALDPARLTVDPPNQMAAAHFVNSDDVDLGTALPRRASLGEEALDSSVNSVATFHDQLDVALSTMVGSKSYKNLFATVQWTLDTTKQVTCRCSTEIQADWLSQHYQRTIRRAVESTGILRFTLKFLVVKHNQRL